MGGVFVVFARISIIVGMAFILATDAWQGL